MEEGDGARVRRLFPVAGCRNADPFVLFDEFRVTPPAGFPPHPHRGFEAITYMFDGSFRHEDNLGNRSTVSRGGAQRFTAGRGLVHSETPGGSTVSHGIQLWINLAKAKKKIAPEYQQVNADAFPEVTKGNVFIRTIVGKGSPLKLKTPVVYLDISFTDADSYTIDLPAASRQLLIYVASGQVEMEGVRLEAGQAALNPKTVPVQVHADGKARLIALSGHIHGESIYQHGPFVD